MSKIDVMAGDFLHGEASYQNGYIHIETVLHKWPGINLPATKISRLFVVDSESWVIAIPRNKSRALVLGKGVNREVTFMIEFKDGRVLLGSTDSATVHRIVHSAESCTGDRKK